MKHIGNIRKMTTTLGEEANYTLPLFDVLEKNEKIEMNPLVGKEISLCFEGEIHCVATGKKINKTFGEGLSYEAFLKSPMASPSIIRPELSRIHEGIALRDETWEREHHLQPHVTYLSLTSGIKVGVTRSINMPSRWIDQGASQAIILAETPYRQAAGLIEVELKDYVTDKTNWRKMLKNEVEESLDLATMKNELTMWLSDELQEYVSDDDTITHINYPVLKYPIKVKSMKLDKSPIIEKKLVGIKGQYLIFEDDSVFNMRSHAGYKVSLTFEAGN